MTVRWKEIMAWVGWWIILLEIVPGVFWCFFFFFFFCVVEKGEEKKGIRFIRQNRIVEWWKHMRSIGGGGSVWRQVSRD